MPNLLLVMTGGAIGAGLRYEVGRAATHWLGLAFPWGTLIVNLLGGLLMGVLAGLVPEIGGPARLLLGAGILGGFTTFSAFGLEVAALMERGEAPLAATYVAASVAGSVAMLFLGLWLARAAA